MIKNLEESLSEDSYRMPEKAIALKQRQKNGDEDSYNGEGKNVGHWCEEENTKYIVFVEGNRQNFQRRKQRKIWKIFKTMSVFVGSRDTYQCRSHHQKMLGKYGNISNLLKEMKVLYSHFNFPEALAQFYKTHKIIPKEKKSNNTLKNLKQTQENTKKPDSEIILENPILENQPFCIEPSIYQNFYPMISYYPEGSLQFLNFIQGNFWGNPFMGSYLN